MSFQNNDVPDVITAKEVASILKIGKAKAYELMRSNEIESFRVGERAIRTTRQALIKYLNEKVS